MPAGPGLSTGEAMAGDWIKIETVTPDKPEIDMIAEALDIDVDSVLGKLVRLWAWADQQTLDGNATNVTKSAIDRRASVPGFADAMISAGWLSTDGGGITFPNFDRHNGQTGKTRALTAKRVATHKAQKGNADSVSGALPREEKSRVRVEEKKEEKRKKKDATPFDEWWSHYPRKVGKEAARKAYSAAVKRLDVSTAGVYLLNRVKAFSGSPKAKGEYCPHPATWLNQGRYDDDTATWQDSGGVSKPPQRETIDTSEL